jgi:hypothetical protein
VHECYPILVLSPVAGLWVNCASQIVVARLARSRSPYFSMALGIASGLLVTLGAVTWSLARMESPWTDAIGFLVMNLAGYLALAFGYFNFVNLTIASLRIRMLEELQDAGGSLPRESMLAMYNTDHVIALRISRLLRGGHLVEREGRFYSGKMRFLLVGRVYNLLRWIIIGPWKPIPACSKEPVSDESP